MQAFAAVVAVVVATSCTSAESKCAAECSGSSGAPGVTPAGGAAAGSWADDSEQPDESFEHPDFPHYAHPEPVSDAHADAGAPPVQDASVDVDADPPPLPTFDASCAAFLCGPDTDCPCGLRCVTYQFPIPPSGSMLTQWRCVF